MSAMFPSQEICTEPILLICFNRLREAEAVMGRIQQAKPARLYLASDGPRDDRRGERQTVMAVRRRLLEMIDWPCSVKTLWRESNLGCKFGVSSAITWFFE